MKPLCNERYTSNHTEAILAQDQETITHFTTRVQSSCTVVNASTRFNDEFSLGLGAEVGASTSKFHAYGPMGLEELTKQRCELYGYESHSLLQIAPDLRCAPNVNALIRRVPHYHVISWFNLPIKSS